MQKISFLKIREVKSPDRAHAFDAGIDFFVPKFTPEFINDLKEKNPDIFVEEKPEYSSNGYLCVGPDMGHSGTIRLSSDNNNSRIKYDLSDEEDKYFRFDSKTGKPYFLLPPHARILIPSGIKSRMNGAILKGDYSYALIAFNKSGVAVKHGLDVGACVVDQTYKGEIHINLINTSTKNVRIYEDMKAVQFLEMMVNTREVEVIDEEHMTAEKFYEGMINDRGEGGFGSTDNKGTKKYKK